MKWTSRTRIELVAIVAMTVVVFVLGVLQYEWTGRISRTEQDRLQNSLTGSIDDFTQEFDYDFERLSEAFLVDPELPPASLEARLAHLYSAWSQTATDYKLLDGIYVWTNDGPHGPQFQSLDPVKQRFQPAVWSPGLSSVPRWVSQQSTDQSWIGDRDAVYYPWTLLEDGPALIRPIFRVSSQPSGVDPQVQPIGYLILALDREYIENHYFPELVDRHFGVGSQRNFGVAIRNSQAPYRWTYQSDPALFNSSLAPDAVIDLLANASEEARRRGRPTLLPSSAAQKWELVVQHPAGSLEVAVAASRRRSLAVGFTLLAVLATCVFLFFSIARRDERLAKLQMDFVTGVSHELCTPLAVINSAAENLIDGVVEEPGQIQEYGGLIRDQSRRLERLVDEVLMFAADRSGKSQLEPRPLEISGLLARSLDSSEAALREAGFMIEREIPDDLPTVVADPVALGKCVDNLVSNAMKYSGPNRWIAVRARVVPSAAHSEVQITVQDKGVGIPPGDLPHVFEPFYRVQSARDGQTRGVGLGLYLVKSMMEGMGGRVTVASEVGLGSFFTLHLPVRAGVAELPSEAPSVRAN